MKNGGSIDLCDCVSLKETTTTQITGEWNLMKSNEIHWNPMKSYEIQWNPQKSDEINRKLLLKSGGSIMKSDEI